MPRDLERASRLDAAFRRLAASGRVRPMGVDFTALVDHRLSFDEIVGIRNRLGRLADRVMSLHSAATRNPDVREPVNGWSWSLRRGNTLETEWRVHRDLTLLHNAPVTLRFGERSVELHDVTRWRHFRSDEQRCGLLQEVVMELAIECGSECAIYLPDTGLWRKGVGVDSHEAVRSGLTVSACVERLSKIGFVPVTRWADLHDLAFFLDEFKAT